MCFSPEVRFATGVALVPAGVYGILKAVRKAPRYLPPAVVPIVFAVRQTCEGFVWVGLERGDPALIGNGAVAFLFFALWFWPFWAPFRFVFPETRPGVRRASAAVALLGFAFGAALYLPIATDPDRWLRSGSSPIRYPRTSAACPPSPRSRTCSGSSATPPSSSAPCSS